MDTAHCCFKIYATIGLWAIAIICNIDEGDEPPPAILLSQKVDLSHTEGAGTVVQEFDLPGRGSGWLGCRQLGRRRRHGEPNRGYFPILLRFVTTRAGSPAGLCPESVTQVPHFLGFSNHPSSSVMFQREPTEFYSPQAGAFLG